MGVKVEIQPNLTESKTIFKPVTQIVKGSRTFFLLKSADLETIQNGYEDCVVSP